MKNFRPIPPCILRKMPGNLPGRTDGQTEGRTDGRTCRKTVTVGRVDQWTHVQVQRGYFRLQTDGLTDGQPENIMPLAPKGGGIMTPRIWPIPTHPTATVETASIGQPIMTAQPLAWTDCIRQALNPLSGLILGLPIVNERWRYFVTMSLFGWAEI